MRNFRNEGATGMPAEPQIDVTELEPCWVRELPGAVDLCVRAAAAALGAGGSSADVEVSIALSDDASVRQLNRDYRKQDKSTNVLSFPSNGPVIPGQPRFLGDVVLARETLFAEAMRFERPPAAHLSHLVVHGVLHLLGFDHEDDAEAARMESLETTILERLGIPDPYAERALERADSTT